MKCADPLTEKSGDRELRINDKLPRRRIKAQAYAP